MDAFDTFWRWANKPLQDHAITIDADLHHAVTSLPEADWHDRQKVNAAAQNAKSSGGPDSSSPPER